MSLSSEAAPAPTPQSIEARQRVQEGYERAQEARRLARQQAAEATQPGIGSTIRGLVQQHRRTTATP